MILKSELKMNSLFTYGRERWGKIKRCNINYFLHYQLLFCYFEFHIYDHYNFY